LSATSGFLDELQAGAERDRLVALLDDVRAREGPDAAVACIEAWVARVAGQDDDGLERHVRSLLFEALDESARRGEVTERRKAALRAVELTERATTDSALDESRRAKSRLLILSVNDDDALRRALEGVGGKDEAFAALESQLKTERVKRDATEVTAHRRALARVAEIEGDLSRAFFESLKVLRKAPEEPLFVDEAFRYALSAHREAELVLVFRELADDVALPASHRATVHNKIAHMLERSLDDARGALAAYVSSLALVPSSKGARRHAERLARALDVAVDLDAPPAATSHPIVEEVPESSPRGTEPPTPRSTEAPATSAASSTSPAPRSTTPAPSDVDAVFAAPSVADEATPVQSGEPSFIPLDHTLPAEEVVDDSLVVENTVVTRERFAEFSGIDSMSPEAATVADSPRRGAGTPSVPPPLPDDALIDRAPLDDAPLDLAPLDVAPPLDDAKLSDALHDDALHDADTPVPMTSEPSSIPSAISIELSSMPSSPGRTTEASLEMVSAVLLNSQGLVEVSERAIVDERSARDRVRSSGPPVLPFEMDDEVAERAPSMEITRKSPVPPTFMPTVEAGEELADLARKDAERHAKRADATADVPLPENTRVSTPDVHTDEAAKGDVSGEGATHGAPRGERRKKKRRGPRSSSGEGRAATVASDEIVPVDAPPEVEAPLSDHEIAARALLVGTHEELVELAGRRGLDDVLRLRLLVAALVLRPGDGKGDVALRRALTETAQRGEDRRRALVDVLTDARESLLADHREDHARLFASAERLLKCGESALSVDERERVFAPIALLERGPGPLFRAIDDALLAQGLVDRRVSLVERAIRQATDTDARVALLVHEADLLEFHDRPTRALAVLMRLALEEAPQDLALRSRARAAFSQHGDDDEHAVFLARLVDVVSAPDERASIWRSVAQLRARLGDAEGSERALREVLALLPDDIAALDGWLAHHVDDVSPERAELLARRLGIARRSKDSRTSLRLAKTSMELLTALGRERDAFLVLVDEVESGGPDAALVDALRERSGTTPNAERALPALEACARRAETPRDVAGRALLAAANLAKDPLRRRARALELVDRALELDPSNASSLLLKSDLAIEVGDAQGALLHLERLVGATSDRQARARLQVRVGRLLEEHLLRLDDALHRYRAAAEDDSTLREAWDHLRALARQRDDRDNLVVALTGLVGLSVNVDERVALRREIARMERDERVDLARAEAAFQDLIALAPTDDDALTALVDLVVGRLVGEGSPENALRAPPSAVVDALRAPFAPVRAAFETTPSSTLPAQVLRVLAAHFEQDGDAARARDAYERVLVRAPADRFALEGLARVLDGASSSADRARWRDVLEALLLQHAPHLGRATAGERWCVLAALRRESGDVHLAKKAAQKGLELIDDVGLRALAPSLIDALADALADDDDPVFVRLHARVLRVHAGVKPAPARVPLLLGAAERVLSHTDDTALARALIDDAALEAPRAKGPVTALLALERARGTSDGVISALSALADREDDGHARAELLVELAERLRTERKDHVAALDALARAIAASPTHEVALTRAESLFVEHKDPRGLVDLLTTRLRALPLDDKNARLALLERIAQLHRYELRDSASAIEALEAMTSLDGSLLKPREDCARLYTDVGNWRSAAQAWRGVLELDVLSVEAWRGLFQLFQHTEQADEALAIAHTMVATDVGDPELARTVRALRAPFPRWPRAPENGEQFRRRVAHDLERTPIRALLEPIGRRVHPMFARPLKDFAVRRRDRLVEKDLAPSVLLALRTVTDLLGLERLPDLYAADLTSDDGASVPPFALLPADEPALIVAKEVLEGGMTPERAFALGRAAEWLTPHGLLAGALDPAELKGVLEALVLLFAPEAPLEGDRAEMGKLARALEREIFRGVSSRDAEVLKSHLAAAARDYAHAREQLHVTDWSTGVGYTGDRVGFLLAGDLTPAVRVIRATGGRRQALGARLAIKELVLFSVSASYLALRRELGLSLPHDVARAILDV